MAQCQNCGTELHADDAFCHACGAPVSGTAPISAAESSGRRIGRIVLIVVALLLGIAVGVGGFILVSRLLGGTGGTGSAETGPASSLVTTTVAGGGSTTTSPTPPPVVTPPEQPPKITPPKPPKPKPNPADVTHEATWIIHHGASGGSVTLTCDYVQFLTGSAAQSAAAAHGDTVENDYYVVNDNPLLRKFALSSGVVIILHPGNGPQYSRHFTVDEFTSLMDSHEATYGGKLYSWANQTTYWINVVNGKISRIEQQWVP